MCMRLTRLLKTSSIEDDYKVWTKYQEEKSMLPYEGTS